MHPLVVHLVPVQLPSLTPAEIVMVIGNVIIIVVINIILYVNEQHLAECLNPSRPLDCWLVENGLLGQ